MEAIAGEAAKGARQMGTLRVLRVFLEPAVLARFPDAERVEVASH